MSESSLTHSRNLYRKIILFLFFIFGVCESSSKIEEEYVAEYLKIREVSQKLFKAEDWAGLEKLLSKSLKERDLVLKATYTFRVYSTALEPKNLVGKGKAKLNWGSYYKKLASWKKAAPDSIFTPPVEIEYWTAYAWDARGTGYAGSVTEKGWKLFRERLAKANTVFEKELEEVEEEEAYPNPLLYKEASTIALGQGWENEHMYRTLCEPLIDHYPWYYSAQSSFAVKFAPQWGGGEDATLHFFERVADDLPPEHAAGFYARTLLLRLDWILNDYKGKVLTVIDKDLLLEGTLQLLELVPNEPYYLDQYLRFLQEQEDGEGSEYYLKFKEEYPEVIEKLKHVSQKIGTLERTTLNEIPIVKKSTFRIQASKADQNGVRSCHLLDAENEAIVSLGWYGLYWVNTETGDVKEHVPRDTKWPYRTAISADKTHLAVSRLEDRKSDCVIYDISGGNFKEVALIPDTKYFIKGIQFSPDNQELLMNCAIPKKKFECLASWSWQDGKEIREIKKVKFTAAVGTVSVDEEQEQIILAN